MFSHWEPQGVEGDEGWAFLPEERSANSVYGSKVKPRDKARGLRPECTKIWEKNAFLLGCPYPLNLEAGTSIV